MHRPGGAWHGAKKGVWRLPLLLVLAGCSEVLNPDVLDVEMLAEPPLVNAPASIKGSLKEAIFMRGADGAPWAAVRIGDGTAVAMQRLSPPLLQTLLPVEHALFPAAPAQSLCAVFKKPRDNTYTVSLMRPGEQKGALQTPLPSNPVVLCGQRTLVAYPTGLDPTHLDVQRRLPNGEVAQLWLPWPRGANPDWDQGPRGFDQDEDVLVVINGDYHTQIYYLDTKEVVDLGPVYLGATVAGHYVYIDFDGFLHAFVLAEQRTLHLGFRLSPDGQLLGFDVDNLAVLTCDWDGVRQVAIRPVRSGEPVVATQRVLDPEPCSAEYSSLAQQTGTLVYGHGTQTRAVRLDGSSPARILSQPGSQQLFGICQDQAVAYSLDSPDRYGKGIGDGWLGGFRFMERGRDVRFSPDCLHLHFKEHAADLRKLGELQSLIRSPTEDFSAAQRLRLARNAGFYQELPDGRLLVAENLAVIGTQNRVTLIDETARTARVLMQGVGAVTGVLPLGTYFPGRYELILEVDTPELDNDRYLLYVPIPAPADSPPH